MKHLSRDILSTIQNYIEEQLEGEHFNVSGCDLDVGPYTIAFSYWGWQTFSDPDPEVGYYGALTDRHIEVRIESLFDRDGNELSLEQTSYTLGWRTPLLITSQLPTTYNNFQQLNPVPPESCG